MVSPPSIKKKFLMACKYSTNFEKKDTEEHTCISLPGLVIRKQSEQAYKKCSSVVFASEAPDSRFLPWLPSQRDGLLLSYVYFMCEHSACALEQQKTASHAITHGCEPLCGYWELNSGPLEKQPGLLTAEPSLQPPQWWILSVSQINPVLPSSFCSLFLSQQEKANEDT